MNFCLKRASDVCTKNKCLCVGIVLISTKFGAQKFWAEDEPKNLEQFSIFES